MRILIALLLMTGPAAAHVGHVGVVAGHDHWVAGIAIGVAVGVGLWGALKGKKDPETEEPDEIDTEEEPA